jgi:hypothetical protein
LGAEDPERVTAASAAIQGGTTDDKDTGVWLIGMTSTSSMCTATLIAPNVLLTAHHCVSTSVQGCATGVEYGPVDPPSGYGLYRDTSFDGTLYGGVQEVRTPVAAGECSTDVAIIITKKNYTPTYEPRVNQPAAVGEPAYAVGYGVTCASCSDTALRRRRDGFQVSCTSSNCSTSAGNLPIDPDVSFVSDSTACHGDSGGPLLDAQNRLIGVNSTAVFANNNCVSVVETRVDKLKDWLVSTVLDAAKLGGYDAPAWAGGTGPNSTAATDTPPASTGSAGGTGAGGSTGAAGSSNGGAPNQTGGSPSGSGSPSSSPPTNGSPAKLGGPVASGAASSPSSGTSSAQPADQAASSDDSTDTTAEPPAGSSGCAVVSSVRGVDEREPSLFAMGVALLMGATTRRRRSKRSSSMR